MLTISDLRQKLSNITENYDNSFSDRKLAAIYMESLQNYGYNSRIDSSYTFIEDETERLLNVNISNRKLSNHIKKTDSFYHDLIHTMLGMNVLVYRQDHYIFGTLK